MKRTRCSITGLTKYGSELAAKIALATIASSNKHHSKRGFREEPTEYFKCRSCKQYHLRRASSAVA